MPAVCPDFTPCGNIVYKGRVSALWNPERGALMSMSSSGKPTRTDLRRLVDRLRPKIVHLFERNGVSGKESEMRVTAALIRLSYQWDKVCDREGWLLTELQDALSLRQEKSSKEPRDE
jgi:hypothetical protein